MAFRRRRFGRRRFGSRRPVARKEPIWLSTAFDVTRDPNVENNDLFELVGPEDYTPDYNLEAQRKDKCTLIRTVGQFRVVPSVPDMEGGKTLVRWKAMLFAAGDREIENEFLQDPNQFNQNDPVIWTKLCRDFSPMHIFWQGEVLQEVRVDSLTSSTITQTPPCEPLKYEWDVRVRRKMEGDTGLWLLISSIFFQSTPGEIGGELEIESRNLIMDQ